MPKHHNWMESSLTSPADRISTRAKPWRPASSAPPLTDAETDKAMEELNITSYIALEFPRKDKTFVDPAIINQVYSLFSFVPSKEATPDKNGVYGYGKIRGCFASDIEANQRAEYIIRNVDSYHPIYHGFVGRPFPITSKSDYSAEVNEIDIKKQMTESISTDVKNKKLEEKREIEEMQNREKALLEESKSIQDGTYKEDPFENYITLKVKKAQLTWTYVEHKNKMKEIEGILAKTKKELEDLDSSDPSYKERYFDKYKQARNISGINETPQDLQDNFIKYMVEDLEIPEVNKLYDELYPKNTEKDLDTDSLPDLIEDEVSEPVEAASEPVEAASETVEAESEPVEAASEPVEEVHEASEPVELVEAVSEAVEEVSEPVEPVEAVSEAVEAVEEVSEPVEAVSEPVDVKKTFDDEDAKEAVKKFVEEVKKVDLSEKSWTTLTESIVKNKQEPKEINIDYKDFDKSKPTNVKSKRNFWF